MSPLIFPNTLCCRGLPYSVVWLQLLCLHSCAHVQGFVSGPAVPAAGPCVCFPAGATPFWWLLLRSVAFFWVNWVFLEFRFNLFPFSCISLHIFRLYVWLTWGLDYNPELFSLHKVNVVPSVRNKRAQPPDSSRRFLSLLLRLSYASHPRTLQTPQYSVIIFALNSLIYTHVMWTTVVFHICPQFHHFWGSSLLPEYPCFHLITAPSAQRTAISISIVQEVFVLNSLSLLENVLIRPLFSSPHCYCGLFSGYRNF